MIEFTNKPIDTNEYQPVTEIEKSVKEATASLEKLISKSDFKLLNEQAKKISKITKELTDFTNTINDKTLSQAKQMHFTKLVNNFINELKYYNIMLSLVLKNINTAPVQLNCTLIEL